jgi:CheY-like chemotaxis protein
MLAGRTVLIVETEFIIALGIQTVVEGLGAGRVIIACNVDDAYAGAAQWASAALAVIELELARPELIELARQISQSGIRVLGVSANARLATGVPELPDTPIVIKPVTDAALIAAIEARLTQ